jgi:hypothetical protein
MRPIDLESIAVSNITRPPSSAAMAGKKRPGIEIIDQLALGWRSPFQGG